MSDIAERLREVLHLIELGQTHNARNEIHFILDDMGELRA
jgi:hypothetical protein